MTSEMAAPAEDEWLVEIRVKDWIHVPDGQSRVVTFEEVLARDEIVARHRGFEQFERRSRYEPVMRQILHRRQLTLAECCAPDAVQVSVQSTGGQGL